MAHPLAGKPPTPEMLVDVDRLVRQYREERPDPTVAEQRVAFGTSGHRGSAARRSFNEAHILAVAQAIAEYRARQGTDGPLFLGMDTHALSAPAHASALEVLSANGVDVRPSANDVPVATPVISHAILTWNRGRARGLADGVVVTPSHNPPEDGGIKYNSPDGGPADTTATKWIEDRANDLVRARLDGVKRAARVEVKAWDYVTPYVEDLSAVLDLDAVRDAGIRIGVDPLGGANLALWRPIAERYALKLTVVNDRVDPTFAFMPLDHDGKIRMDCSSPYAMTNLVAMKDRFDVAFGNDADSDRHGIVTPSVGLMNPNHYLAVAIDYLFASRSWPGAGIGKTLVSSSMIDRVAARLGRKLVEVPVGFKWFVGGLLDGTLGFGGEESAGASFLRRDGRAWSTDKDGVILGLLAAEILAKTGKDPGVRYRELEAEFGAPRYRRVDAPATPAQKAVLKKLSPSSVTASTLAGEPITAKLTRAPGNDAEIGGLKVTTANGWFAARPSGTEDVYKIYAESFISDAHLSRILSEAQAIVDGAIAT